jgi:beta-glucosidase
MRRVDQAIDFIWKDTTPVTGRWGDHFAVRWTGLLVPPKSGRYTLGVHAFSKFSLSLDGKRIVNDDNAHHPVLRTKEVDLVAGRSYEIRLDYVNRGLDPQVKLVWSVPGTEDDSTALEVAEEAEIVVLVLGLSPALEGEEMSVKVEGFSGGDRTDIKLPRPQEKLLRQIHALGKPVVLVLLNGSALAVNWAAEHIPAIIEAWYPGQAGGEALADVLFGDYNPAGRLPVTFYRSVENLPPFEDYRMRGRTYRYFRGEPLFPFGYGLSYTTFEFDNLRIIPAEVEAGPDTNRGFAGSEGRSKVQAGAPVAVSVDVSNTGDLGGDEVVQLYIHHRTAPVPCPVKELKGFKRISLQPGERKGVTFTLSADQLGIWDAQMNHVIQPGTVEVRVGNSSQHLPLTGTFEIVGQTTEIGEDRGFFSRVHVD